MGNRQLKNACMALVMLTAGAVVVSLSGHAARAGNGGQALKELPVVCGGWKLSEEITFEKRIIAVLGTREVKGALYRDTEGRAVRLIIVQASNNRAAFHPPEYCLTGQGSEIIEQRVASCGVPGGRTLPVNEMVLLADTGSRLLVWNWYAAGAELMHDFYGQQWKLFVDQLFRGTGRGTAVNMYVEIGNAGIPGARRAMEDFAAALAPLLEKYL